MPSVKDYVRDERRERSKALDILNTEKLILKFIQEKEWKITDYWLYDFWKYIEKIKDDLPDRFEK